MGRHRVCRARNSGRRGIGAAAAARFIAGIGAPHDKNLEAFLDAGKPDDAARCCGENRSYFWDNAEQLKPLLARLKGDPGSGP